DILQPEVRVVVSIGSRGARQDEQGHTQQQAAKHDDSSRYRREGLAYTMASLIIGASSAISLTGRFVGVLTTVSGSSMFTPHTTRPPMRRKSRRSIRRRRLHVFFMSGPGRRTGAKGTNDGPAHGGAPIECDPLHVVQRND